MRGCRVQFLELVVVVYALKAGHHVFGLFQQFLVLFKPWVPGLNRKLELRAHR
jgi:hypothetical protein